MASIQSLGGAPISFVDANGMQYAIPLSWIAFSGTPAAAVATSWPGWGGTANGSQAGIASWLAALSAAELLLPGAAPPSSPVLTLTARDAGTTGNDITVRFGTVYANDTVDVTVSTTQIYPGLTVASIETVLGTAPLGGTEPGLAYVGTLLNTLPTATAGLQPFTAAAAGDPFEFEIPGSGGGVLLPTNDATTADSGYLQASITAVDTTANTFTLTLSWSKTAAGLTLAALGGAFAYVLKVALAGSGSGQMPAANTSVTLLGGAGPSSAQAVAASATVISG